MKKIIFLVLLLTILQALGAQNQTKNNNSKELSLAVSSLLEIKLGFTERYYIPFLQGNSPLTSDNNVDIALRTELSPVSLNELADLVWTPIAFFQLAAGGRIGSGWNISTSGADSYGIGITRPDADGMTEVNGSVFDGMLWKLQAGGAIQFDLAALYPGDWHHVVARSYHEINYKGYTRAGADESWYFENDEGENCNGYNYYGNLLIGYKMPIFFNIAALLAEADLYLYDQPERGRWGDDRIRWTFSGIFNFTINEQFDAALIAQFRTRRNYLESNWEDLYYRNRTIDRTNPQSLEFFRVAAIITFKF